jgi:hypothetical protein
MWGPVDSLLSYFTPRSSMMLPGWMMFLSTSTVVLATFQTRYKNRSCVFAVFMLRPIFRMFSTKSAAFSASFLSHVLLRAPCLPDVGVVHVDNNFILFDPDEAGHAAGENNEEDGAQDRPLAYAIKHVDEPAHRAVSDHALFASGHVVEEPPQLPFRDPQRTLRWRQLLGRHGIEGGA